MPYNASEQQYTLDKRSLRALARLLRKDSMRISNLESKMRQVFNHPVMPRDLFMGIVEEDIPAMENDIPSVGRVKIYWVNDQGEYTERRSQHSNYNDGEQPQTDPGDGFMRISARSIAALSADSQVTVTRDSFGIFWILPSTDSPDLILDFPATDTDNFLLPGDITGTAYAHRRSINANDYFQVDTSEELVVKDMISYSCFLPGQWGTFKYSSVLNAYIPWPFGQNRIQRAKTYRDIAVGETSSGNDVFLVNEQGENVVEFSEGIYNIQYNHATSEIPIEASQDDPREFWVMLTNEAGGGVIWNVLVPECNPGFAAAIQQQ